LPHHGPPILALDRYAGAYRDAWHGDIVIAREGGGLTMRFSRSPLLYGDLVHWQYDTFLVRWRDRELRADAYVSFALAPDGSIARASMAPASPRVDFSFDFQDLELEPVRDPGPQAIIIGPCHSQRWASMPTFSAVSASWVSLVPPRFSRKRFRPRSRGRTSSPVR
jgi:hypothetical protein